MRVRLIAAAGGAEELAKGLQAAGHVLAADEGDGRPAEAAVVDGISGAEASRWAAEAETGALPVIAGLTDIPGGVEAALEAGVGDVYPAGDVAALLARLAVLERLGPQEAGARLAAAAVNDAMFTLGFDGRLRWVNPAAERLTGYGQDQLVGMHMLQLVRDPAEAARAAEELEQKRDGLLDASLLQLHITTATGEVVPVEVNSRVVTREGRPWAVEGVARDLRPRRAMEERLRREAELFAHLGVAAVATDRKGRILTWNREAERLFGRSEAEMRGLNALDLVAGSAGEAAMREVAKLAAGADISVELKLRRADGATFPALVRGTPLRDESGAVVGSVGAIVDLSEERARQAELARLAAIVESAEDAVIGRDLEGRITSWNRAAERLFGYTAAEMVGGLGLETVPEHRREEYLERLSGIAAAAERPHDPGAAPEVVEVERMDRWGRVFPAQASTFLVYDRDGRPTGAASFVRDISRERAMTAALREREATLRGVFESTQDHLWLLDRDGKLVMCNGPARAFARAVFGREPQPGDSMVMFADGEHRGLLAGVIRKALAGEAVQGELAARDAAGRRVYFDIQVNPVRDGEGGVTGVLVSARDVTEQARTRRELQRAREELAAEYAKLATILENSDEGVALLDRDLRLIAFNSTFAEGTRLRRGVSPEPGMPFEACVSPESAPYLVARVREALAGRWVAFEVQSRTPGQQRWFEVRIRPVVGRDGEVTGVVYTGRDVTGRRLLELEREAALAEARRLATVVESSTEAVIAIGRDGRIESWNRAAEELYGWTAAEALGQPFTMILPPEEAERGAALFARLLSGEALRGEMPRVTKDGRRLVVESAYFPLRDAEGRVTGVGCTSHDVTRQREMERQIAEQAADLEGTLRAIHEGLALLDPDGRVLLVNPAMQETIGAVFGVVPGPGMHWREVVPPEHEAGFGEVIAETLAGGTPSFEQAVTDREGNQRVLELSFGRVLLPDGGVRGVAVTLRDVTERKRTEQRLLQAQKAESLAVLAGGIAHDFNNLLVGILGNAGLALAELPPESPVRATIADIETAGQRAADLARQMLAYSGRGKFVVGPLQLNALVEEMAHLLRVSVGAGVRLVLDLAPGLPPVVGDATQLRQVVMNLVINASDAIGAGEGTVRVTTAAAPGRPELFAGAVVTPGELAARYVVLEVADTGSGMDAATLTRIFDPFFTTKFTGRGLGLAAVLGIVRGHQGGISVTSAPGEGTRFRVMLPAAGELPPAEEGTRSTAAWRGSGLVIVADDEPGVRKVTARALSGMGFEVLEAEDGQAAVELFAQHRERVVLVLLDMTMPRMNGQAAFRAIRALDPGAKVVLMSGYTEQDAAEQFAEGGLAGFLQKPYELGGLQELVRRVAGDSTP
ncbi:PAS domain-containing hybrid sensor histidine kinase/response regulator [Tepidiforma thermophila]|uniref:histidine kinase n=1 Tax=Tepidiforma thermophila (strain KCTC 52669 / CGMCC 1.13589 / G233) TaxID=2761530 RepID=A0A2A9HA65_TEPT2|nr:PAS domain S-box protein [Tepidiforma thermophila]PFG72837.1 PAS domain S-box-containing protein [Tepidiforma thermophila]